MFSFQESNRLVNLNSFLNKNKENKDIIAVCLIYSRELEAWHEQKLIK